jgi:predicted ATP-dependent protease
MPDSEENRLKLVQFFAQEIVRDGRIPHADSGAIEELLSFARRKAKEVDGKPGLTLRLRTLSGAVKMAGDLASSDGKPLITREDVSAALASARPIEEQAGDKYGSWYRASLADAGMKNHAGDSSEVR